MPEPSSVTPGLPAERPIRIGEWLLVPATHSLSDGTTQHRLPKRLVTLLLTLALRPGETWSREALIEAVWTRKQVNDEVLSRAVAELRSLLGDDAREPRYIETLPKTGYRLLAPVIVLGAAEITKDDAASAGAARAASPPAIRLAWPWLLLALFVAAATIWWTGIGKTPGDQALLPPDASGQPWSAADLVRELPFRSGPHWAWQPRFSRDGRWLVYAVNDLGAGDSWIEWSSADGSAPRRLDSGSGRPAAPVFSPDGARIAFTAWTPEGCVLRVLDLPAGAPRDLAPCGGSRSHPLDWPAAQRLLYTGVASEAEAPSGLWQIDPDSAERRPLTEPSASAVLDTHPRERGDGALAFLRGPDGLRELWLREEGVERRLLPGAHRIPDLAWTADGRGLIVASDKDGFPALHWLAPDSGELRLLGGRGAATLAVAADGGLLYERRRYDANLWSYGEGEPQRLTDSTRYEAFAALSEDGDGLLYVSNRDGNGSVWMQRAGAERRLALPQADAWVRPRWLDPDHVLLTRYNAGGATVIEVFQISTQRLREEHALAGPGFGALPLPGGRVLLGLGHGDSAGMQLVLRDAKGDEPISGAGQVAEFASDGEHIGWIRRGESDLQLIRLSAPRSDLRSVRLPAAAAAWTLHEGQLVYAARDGAGWALWRQPLAGGEAKRWLSVRTALTDGQIELGGKGQPVVLSHIDEFHSDLMWVPRAP